MGPEPAESEWLSLVGDLRRRVALQCLLGESEGHSELVVFAPQVERVDAVAGAALRVRIDRHLRQFPDGRVMIEPPTRSLPAEHLRELITPLPEGVTFGEHDREDEIARFALVPATIVQDHEAAVAAAGYALEACEHARIADRRANLAAAAVAELSNNALQHAAGSDQAPAVAVTVSGRERVIEVAVVDLGTGISSSERPADALTHIASPEHGNGFLADFLRRGSKRDLDVSIEILSGTATLRRTWAAHRTENGSFVPGTTVVARIAA